MKSASFAKFFVDHDAGVAAIEFALVLPLMLLVWMYLVDFSRGFQESKKLAHYAYVVVDLVSGQPTTTQLDPSTVGAIIGTSKTLMNPYPDSLVTVTVSAVTLTPRIDQTCCDAKVAWSYSRGGTLRPCNVLLQQVSSLVPPRPDTIAAGMINSLSIGASPSQIIVADVRDTYQPLFSGLATLFASGLKQTTYALPRGNGAWYSGADPRRRDKRCRFVSRIALGTLLARDVAPESASFGSKAADYAATFIAVSCCSCATV